MNRIKKIKMFIRLFLLVSLFSSQLQAQNHAEAKALLQEASQAMKAYKGVEIDFIYTFENTRVEPPIRQKQIGTIGIKGDDYRLKVGAIEQLRIGNKLYNILHEDEEVQVSSYDEESEDQGLTPSKLLNLFDSGYSYKLAGSETLEGRKIQYVLLKPNASEEIDKIQIGIDTKTKEVFSMQQWGTNGTATLLEVKKLRKIDKWPQGYLTFQEEKYADYYISE